MRATFHQFPDNLPKGRRYDELIYSAEPGALQLAEIDDALFFDQNFDRGNHNKLFGLVSDGDDAIVQWARTQRGRRKEVLKPPLRSQKIPASSINMPVVYLGILFDHYGHFLLESLSRVWALLEHDFSAHHVLFHGGKDFDKITSPYREFLECVGVNSGNMLNLNGNGLQQVKHLIVPQPSFAIRRSAHQVHREVFRKFAQTVSSGGIKRVSQPLYLSRENVSFDKRNVAGEAVLTRILKDAGVKVVYPETLTIEEQVRLFQQHEVIIGFLGSALHNLFFGKQGTTVHVICSQYPNENYVLCDEINMGLDVHYVLASSIYKHPHHHKSDGIEKPDIEAIISYFQSVGVLKYKGNVALLQKEIEEDFEKIYKLKNLKRGLLGNILARFE